MSKQLASIALAACFVTLLSVGMPNAQTKQQCSAAMPSNPQGHWWSYRLIDGRKCWYEGKPMLSKSLLQWPAQAPVRSAEAPAQSVSDRGPPPVRVLTVKPNNPVDPDACCWPALEADGFEARWRALDAMGQY